MQALQLEPIMPSCYKVPKANLSNIINDINAITRDRIIHRRQKTLNYTEQFKIYVKKFICQSFF